MMISIPKISAASPASRTFVVGVLVLAGVFSHAHPALAQDTGECGYPADTPLPAAPTVTAQQVEDGSASLRDFALAARDQFKQGQATPEESFYFGCLLRQEGSHWRSGSTYIVSLLADGRVFTHSKDMALSGRLLNPVVYGTILSALGVSLTDLANLASSDPAASAEAFGAVMGTLLQEPDAPFDATTPIIGLSEGIPGASGHAVAYLSANYGVPIVMLVGFDLDESHVIAEEIEYGDPAVTASDVVDRETLKAFVTQAGEFLIEAQQSGDLAASSKLRIALRDPNGPWRQGSVYLYMLDLTSNIVMFHGAFPDRFELRPLVGIARDGVTGELILPQVIEAATSDPEGGFVEYFYDNPTDDTDSADIPKVGYARQFTGEFDTGERIITFDFIVGSGFYGSAPEEPAQDLGVCGYPADTPLPAGPTVTAQQVEDGSASLGEFMLAARGRFDELHHEITSFGESLQVHCLTRQEGSPWRSGSTYLVSLTADGRVWQHAKSLGLSGRQVKPLIYGAILQAAGINPAELTDRASAAEAFAAAGDGGLFDLPDIPGASGFAFATPTLSFWIAGFDLDETHLVPVAEEDIEYGDPAVTASDVVDRATLKTFVAEAWDYFHPIWASGDPTAIAKLRIALRDENGPWKDGSVYLYVLERTSDIVLFHGAFPDLFEFQPLVGIARDGVTGELILPQVLEAATSSPEGGFVEYFYDDPTDDTDRADIPKVGYAREFITHGRRIIVGSGFYGSAPEEPEGVAEGARTEVEVTVLGDAVEGLTVEFSRAIAGRPRHFAWNAVTDADGQASLTISGGSGFYQARARNADGEVVGQWPSIPLNRDKRQVLELTLGGGMRVVRVEPLAAAKAGTSVSGLGPNAPNPFNSATQIAYRLSSPGPVQLVIYNVLGQPVRTLVNEFQGAGSYRVQWDARDRQGASLSSGVYIARLAHPGGVQTRRLLYLK